MTDVELLARMAKEGCVVGVTEAGSLRFLPAVIEIVGKKLFWVNQFASDQHDSHAVDFDRTTRNGEVGLAFLTSKGSLVAYVAPYAEWPDINTDDAKEELARWNEYLNDRSNRATFDQFVDSERSLLTEGD
jgi:hypothetical protein